MYLFLPYTHDTCLNQPYETTERREINILRQRSYYTRQFKQSLPCVKIKTIKFCLTYCI